jgi:hypothetical protein
MSRQCVVIKPDGKPCGARPLRERPYCFMHDPDEAERVAEARRLGGNRRRHESTLETVYDLETLDTAAGIQRLIEIAVDDALALDAGIGRIRLLLTAATAATRLLETTNFEGRIEALEAVLGTHRRDATPPNTTESALDRSEK